jgi:hypothetical protein
LVGGPVVLPRFDTKAIRVASFVRLNTSWVFIDLRTCACGRPRSSSAIASNGELKAGYYVAAARKYITRIETEELIVLNESIAKMLRRWQATLETRDEEPANGNRIPTRGRRTRR